MALSRGNPLRAHLLILLLGSLLAVPSAAAQERAVCLRSRPAPDCRGWFLFEPFIGQISNQTSPGGDRRVSDAFYGFEIGAMGNLAARHAAGGSVVAGSLGYGFRARYRYWATRDVAYDLSPGLLWEEDEGLTRVELTGSAMVLGRAGGFVGVSRHLQRDRWEWSFGIKAGGEPGMVLTVVGLAYLFMLSRGLSRL